MNGKSITRLLIVLVVLVGVFLVVKFTGNSGRSESFRSDLVDVDVDKVTKVEILSTQDTTLLEKQGDDWKVDGKYVADEATVKAMIQNLENIQPSRLASRSEDSWKDFQVDDSGTRVIVHEGNDKTLDIVLGRFNVSGQRSYHSYVRLSDDKDVYVADNFMKMSISQGANAYRNDDVLRLEKDSVESIAFNYPDSGFVLEQGMSGWEVAGALADSASVANYLQGLRYLNSRKFTDATQGSALYDVKFTLKDGSNASISAYSNGAFTSSQNQEYWEDEAVSEKVFKAKKNFLSKN